MKKLLIVVDYQKDFVSGSLGFKEAILLDDYIYQCIKTYKENNEDVLFTFDTHQEEYLDTKEGKALPICHCLEGSDGWQLYGNVASLLEPSDQQIKKVTFGSLELGNYLSQHPYDEITFVGVVSNICVISNAVIARAALPEATIIIDAKGIASNDPALHQKALDVMEGLQMNIKK